MNSSALTGYEVSPAAALGLDPARLEGLLKRARQEVEGGLLPSAQLAVARHGKLALFETLGEAEPGSRYITFSVIKALVAAAVWRLMGESSLDVMRPVAHYLPDFAREGKGAVTVEQLLTHTAGFPNAPMKRADWGSHQQRVQRMASWRLDWEPGTRCIYHQTAAHWALAAVIETVAGVDYRDYANESILLPLGLQGPRLGEPVGRQQRINDLVEVGEPPGREVLTEALGFDVPMPTPTEQGLLAFNKPDLRALGMPGAGGIGNAADIVLFYQALLCNPGGLWDTDILRDGTQRIRVDLPDPMTGVPANRSLGLVVRGDDSYGSRRGMGKTVSARSFGHNGLGGQIAWADPLSGISFCFLTNGLDANPLRSAARVPALSNRAGACLAD